MVVTLDGSNSYDPDDGIYSYKWTQISGIPVLLSDNSAVAPIFTAPDVGPDGESLEFELLVTDNSGLQKTDNCIVNISWQNEPPVADTTENQIVDAGSTVTLDGSNSFDPDDGISSYEWTQVSGTAVILSDAIAVSPIFTAPNVGLDGETIIFKLTVTDAGGLKGSSECSVKVNPVFDSQVMSLSNSWNLVSLSQSPSNKKVESVLGAISGKYISVWAYDNNQWQVYDAASPGFSDLTEMTPGKGYWINMSDNVEFSISGLTSGDRIELSEGWNLVGYNSTTSKEMSEAISSISSYIVSVWAYEEGQWKVYDPQNPEFSDLTTMEPGYGYWINVSDPCTWIQ